MRELIIAMLLTCCIGCAGTNVMGKKSYDLLPDAIVNKISTHAYQEQKKSTPISESEEKIIVDRVAQRIIDQCTALYPEKVKDFEWEVTLFDAPNTPNAYAMPGGKIGVYTGILKVCANEAQLAAVMGHEVGHAILRHGNERMTQQLAHAGLLKTGELLSQASLLPFYQKHSSIILPAIATGLKYRALSFSRSQESDADEFGLMLMAGAGYNPNEAPLLWDNMKKLGGEEPPEYQSTHPSTDKRIAHLKSLMPKAMQLYDEIERKHDKGAILK